MAATIIKENKMTNRPKSSRLDGAGAGALVQSGLSAGGLACLLALLCAQPMSAGFVLGPHRTVFCNIPVGRKVPADEFGSSLNIMNQTSAPQTYLVEIKKPSQVKRELLFGYEEIPDVKFVIPEREMVVEANSAKPVRLWSNIPDKERYYNRKWEAEIVVREKTTGFGVELEGQLWIETEAKPAVADPQARLGEDFLLAPAILDLKGSRDAARVKLYNLSKSALTFLIVSASPPEGAREMFIPYSAGFERLADQEWITPSIKGEEQIKRIKQGREIAPQKRIRIEPGAYKTINVEMNVPPKKEYGGKRESFIFVRCPELNRSKFVRIRITAP